MQAPRHHRRTRAGASGGARQPPSWACPTMAGAAAAGGVRQARACLEPLQQAGAAARYAAALSAAVASSACLVAPVQQRCGSAADKAQQRHGARTPGPVQPLLVGHELQQWPQPHAQQRHGAPAPSQQPSHSGNGTRHAEAAARQQQQQQQQQQQSSYASSAAAAKLMRRIKQCDTEQQLTAVVQECAAALNIIHASAALTHLAHLSQRQRASAPDSNQQQVVGLHSVTRAMEEQHSRVRASTQRGAVEQGQARELQQQLSGLAMPLLPQATSRQVANMLWALGVLHTPPSHSRRSSSSSSSRSVSGAGSAAGQLSEALMAQAAGLFHVAEPQHLSSIASAVAKLQLPVGAAWLQQLQRAWLQHVVSQQQPAQQRVCSSDSNDRSSSDGGLPPSVGSNCPSAGSGAAAAGPAAPGSRRGISPQATCNLLWALVHFTQQPQGLHRQHAHQQQQQQLLLQAVVADAAPQLCSWPSRSVARLMWACARLGYAPADARQQPGSGAGVAAQLVAALQHHAATASSHDLAQCLWAAAVMGLHVPAGTLRLLVAAGGRQLQTQARQLVRQQPGAESTDGSSSSSGSSSSVGAAEHAHLISASAQQAHSASLAMWSAAKLGSSQGSPALALPSHLVRPWLAALLANARCASLQSLAVGAWGACQLGGAACTPQVVTRLLAAAMHSATRDAHQQQPAAARGNGEASGGAAVAHRLAPGVVVSLLWAAAQSVRAAASAAASATGCAARQRRGEGAAVRGQHSMQGPRQRQQHEQQPSHSKGRHTGAPAGADAKHQAAARAATVQLLLLAAGGHAGEAAAPARGGTLGEQTRQQSAQRPYVLAPGASLRQLAMLLCCCAHLQLALPKSWWRACLMQLAALLDEPRPQEQQQQQHEQQQEQQEQQQQQQQQQQEQDAARLQARGHSLALCVWALGRQGVLVSPALLVRLQQATAPLLGTSGALAPQAYAQLLVGCTLLTTTAACQLPRGRIQQQDQEQAEQQRAALALPASPACGDGSGVDACTTGSVARGWPSAAGLSSAWLWAVVDSAAAQEGACLAAMGARSLVGCLWALGRLRFHPGAPFMAHALARTRQLLPRLQPRQVALLLWALARLQHVPPPALQSALLQAWELRSAAANCVDSQQVAWAAEELARLGSLRAQACGGGGAAAAGIVSDVVAVRSSGE